MAKSKLKNWSKINTKCIERSHQPTTSQHTAAPVFFVKVRGMATCWFLLQYPIEYLAHIGCVKQAHDIKFWHCLHPEVFESFIPKTLTIIPILFRQVLNLSSAFLTNVKKIDKCQKIFWHTIWQMSGKYSHNCQTNLTHVRNIFWQLSENSDKCQKESDNISF